MTRKFRKLMWMSSVICLTATLIGCKKDEVKQVSTSPPAPMPEVTRAITALSQAWGKVTSLSGTIHTKLAQAIDREGRTTGEGTYDLLRTGDKTKIRFDLINTLFIETGWENKAQLGTAEVLVWATDGTVMYQSTRQAKEYYKVIKSKYDPGAILQVGAPMVLPKLMPDYDLTLLPDDVVDEHPVTVIKASPRHGTWTEKHYFDKRNGIEVKHVELDKAGKQTYLLTLTDLKVNVPFKSDHFTYEVPEEAELIDKTQD